MIHFLFILGSKTITLTKPQILKQPKPEPATAKDTIPTKTEFPTKLKSPSPTRKSPNSTRKSASPIRTFSDVFVQTVANQVKLTNQLTQTDEYKVINELKTQIDSLQLNIDKKNKELAEAMSLMQTRSAEIITLNKDKIALEYSMKNLRDTNNQKDALNNRLRQTIDELRKQIDEFKLLQVTESNKIKDSVNEENKSLLLALKQLETDKNTITSEYKELLNNEREEYARSVKELHVQMMEMQSKLDR